MQNPHYIALLLALGWNALLAGYRMGTTGEIMFLFLIWNLILALAPYVFSEWAAQSNGRGWRWATTFLLLLSVLFLPNAPYIITDLFHLRMRSEMLLWYDTLFIFSAAITGWALFYGTLFNIRQVLRSWWHWSFAEMAVAVICILSGFGIYLGRYLRFNSWDVLANPDDLFGQMTDRLINPSAHARMVGFTLLYGAFLLVGYWVVELFTRQPRTT